MSTETKHGAPKMSPKEAALHRIRANWRNDEMGASPSTHHYPHNYLWDSYFIADIAAYFDEPELAEKQLAATVRGMHSDGFAPNMRFNPNDTSRAFDPERITFRNPKIESDYTQPPLLAEAVWETVASYRRQGNEAKARDVIEKFYPYVKRNYDFFARERRLSEDSALIYVIHPHETGRDSDPTYDDKYVRCRLPYSQSDRTPHTIFEKARSTVKHGLNSATHYGSALLLNRELQKRNWTDTADIFSAEDVMFNCLYAENLTIAGKLAEEYVSFSSNPVQYTEDAARYKELSLQVQQEINTKMWDENDRRYYAIDGQTGEKIKYVSVSNLFPLLTDTISPEQIESILYMLESPDWFKTPYPIPSVPVNSPDYDPDYKEKRIWRGPTWINMNDELVKGLLKQRSRFLYSENPDDRLLARQCNKVAAFIAKQTGKLVKEEGEWEFYTPYDTKKRKDGTRGLKGMRIGNFAWSAEGWKLQDKVDKGEFDFSE